MEGYTDFWNETISISFRNARKIDTDGICEIYDSVAVTPENLDEKISDSANSFSERGGMFHPLDRKEITEILDEGKDNIVVGEYCGELGGFLWFGDYDRSVFETLKPFDGCEADAELLKSADAEKNIGYAKDIVTNHLPTSGDLCFMLYANALKKLAADGKKYVVFEIYRIVGIKDGDGRFTKLDIFNNASAKIMDSRKCRAIGETAEKEIGIGKRTVTVRPTIYICDAAESARLSFDSIWWEKKKL